MSICEHLIERGDSSQSTSPKRPEEKLNIQNELIWGLMYRNYKENEKNQPIRPIRSPINIPFEICRAERTLWKKKKHWKNKIEEDGSRKGGGEGAEKPREEKTTTKKRKIEKPPSLLERNVWSQSKYMDYLSIPNLKFEEPKQKKFKKRCELEPCPPRFVQLAVPNKRKVFANWKEYAHFLPTEMLMRFEEILHTDQNLDPREARYYYKKLDKQRRKALKKQKLKKNKKVEKKKDPIWQICQVNMLATDILEYIKDEPLFTLNYKQLMLSDGILERLEKTKIMKKPSRKTKNHYKRTIIEVADKFAIWIDTLTRFVDVQAIESDEDIPPLSISSLSAEGEGESEYESSSEEELRDDQLFIEEEVIWGEEGDIYEEGGIKAEEIIKEIFNIEEGEGATDFEEMLNELDGDILGKLIRILSNCSDDFLDSEIDFDKMPGVKYIDVLNKLKALKKGLLQAGRKPFLEQILIDWALKNDPDKVDDELLKKIHEVAVLLGDFLTSPRKEDNVVDIDEINQGGMGEGGDRLGGEDLEGQGEGGVTGVGDEKGDEMGEDTEANVTEGEGGVTEGEGGVTEGEGGVTEGEGGVTEGEGGVTEGEGAITEGEGGITEGEGGITEGEGGATEGEGGVTDGEGGVTEGEEGVTGSEIDQGLQESKGLFSDADFGTSDEAEGGLTSAGDISGSLHLEGEEEIGLTSEFELGEEQEGEEVSVIFPKEVSDEKEKELEKERLSGRIIKGHEPSKIFEHSPDTVCCLSLKTWAVWLLEITHNAHNWTQWMSCVIQKVREYASIVRGDVKLPSGETKVLRKAEWREFIKETEDNVIAWRQYSAHVKDLSHSIVENFHGKEVNCCPKCLQDHLIKNVVVAHDTLQALTEAISCAAYWQRCLDTLVEKTCGLTQAEKDADAKVDISSEESEGEVDLEEVFEEESGESVYEIEGIETNINCKANDKN